MTPDLVDRRMDELRGNTLLTKSLEREADGDTDKIEVMFQGIRCLLLSCVGRVIYKDTSGQVH